MRKLGRAVSAPFFWNENRSMEVDEHCKMQHKNIIASREPIKAMQPLLAVSDAASLRFVGLFDSNNSYC